MLLCSPKHNHKSNNKSKFPVPKQNVFLFEERENEKYITASVVRISLLRGSMAAQQPQNLRPYPDTSVSFIHNPERKKEKGMEEGHFTWGERKSAVNNITLSI